MTYKEAFSYIKADYLRYSNSVGGGTRCSFASARFCIYLLVKACLC